MRAVRLSRKIWIQALAAMVSSLLATASATAQTGRLPANDGFMGTMGDSEIAKMIPPIPHSEHPSLTDGRRFPRLWLGTVRYEPSTRLTSYSVNDALMATTNLQYIFQIIPQLKTPQGRTEDLSEGYYLMRMAVLLPDVQRDGGDMAGRNEALSLYQRYVTSTERIVQITNGTIRAAVTLSFPFSSATTIRNTLLVQILPVETNSLQFNKTGLVIEGSSYQIKKTNLISSVIRVPFIPRFSSGLATPVNPVQSTDSVIEDDLDLGAFIENAKSFQTKLIGIGSQLSTPEASAQALDLDLVMSKSDFVDRAFKASKSSQRDLDDLLRPAPKGSQILPDDRAKLLCTLAIQNLNIPEFYVAGLMGNNKEKMRAEYYRTMIWRCSQEPGKYLRVSMQLHNLGLRTYNPQLDRGGQTQLNLASSYATNRAESLDVTKTISATLSPLDLWGKFRIGGGYSINGSNSRSRFESRMLSGSTMVEVNFWDLKLHFNKYLPCLAIRADKSLLWGDRTGGRGIYLCSNQVQDHADITERYFHAYPANTSGPSVDVFDPRNQPINMTLRGDSDYYNFLRSIHRVMSPVDDQKPISEMLRKGLRAYQGLGSTQPGVIVIPGQFDGPASRKARDLVENPTLMDRILLRYSENF